MRKDITLTQRISFDRERFEEMCRINNWHINATQEEYEAMIYVDRYHGITLEQLYDLTLNIIKNNDMEKWIDQVGYSVDHPAFQEFMLNVVGECCLIVFSIKEVENEEGGNEETAENEEPGNEEAENEKGGNDEG